VGDHADDIAFLTTETERATMTAIKEYSLGPTKGAAPAQRLQRISLLLWGKAGTGKSTLAASAPGKKLVLNFDPDGDASLTGRDDVIVFDFSRETISGIERITLDDPLGIRAFLRANPEFDTVIVDSITKLNDMILELAVSKIKEASIENPTMRGYQMRSAWIARFMTKMLRVTGELGKNFIVIGHEEENKNDEGALIDIQIMLGGKLNAKMPIEFSESWALTDTGKERRIAIRPCRGRVGLKSRMFRVDGNPEFNWLPIHRHDALSLWLDTWRKSDYKAMSLPIGAA
jgi:phage nucleotide-binding protein